MVNVLKEEKYKNLRIDFRKNPNVPNMIVAYIEGIDDVLVNPVVASTKDEAFNIAKSVIDNYKGDIKRVIPLKKIEMVWSECGVEGTFKTWKEFQNALRSCISEEEKRGPNTGYSKQKVKITWEGGITLVDRLDVGATKGDYSGKTPVGLFMKSEEPFYQSGIKQGSRDTLQWE